MGDTVPTRRAVLQGVTLAGGVLLAGCLGTAEDPAGDDPEDDRSADNDLGDDESEIEDESTGDVEPFAECADPGLDEPAPGPSSDDTGLDLEGGSTLSSESAQSERRVTYWRGENDIQHLAGVVYVKREEPPAVDEEPSAAGLVTGTDRLRGEPPEAGMYIIAGRQIFVSAGADEAAAEAIMAAFPDVDDECLDHAVSVDPADFED